MAEGRICGVCGKPNRGQARFCGYCGKPLQAAKLRKRNRGIFIGSLICSLVGVSIYLYVSTSGQEEARRNLSEYYPLQEKLTWEYQVTSRFGVSGNAILKNLAPRRLKGREVVPQTSNISGQIIINFMAEDSSGIRLIAKQLPTDTEPQLQSDVYALKYPLAVGTTWKDSNGTAVIESVDDVVTVAVGTFARCIRLKFIEQDAQGRPNPNQEGVAWYAPGIGMVKVVSNRTSLQLVNFKK